MTYKADILEFKVAPSPCQGRLFDATWNVDVSTDSKAFTPTYMVQIAETSAGPWEDVLVGVTAERSVEGVGHKFYTHRPGAHLRLVVYGPDGEAACSPPMDPTHGMSRRDYLEYRDLIRRENLALEKVSGFQGYLAKKIVAGCRCECAHAILGGAPDSSCPKCHGTGVTGGYHPPVPMLADWSTVVGSRGDQKETQVGISEVERKVVKTLPYPSASFKDVWIDGPTGNRYAVSKPVPIVYKVFPTAQLFEVSLLPKDDPAYSIPLDG